MIKTTSHDDVMRKLRNRNLSQRQINRRMSKMDEIAKRETNKNLESFDKINGDKILTFGDKSFVTRLNEGINIRVHKMDLATISMVDLQRVLEVAKSPMVDAFKNPTQEILKRAPHKMIHFGIWMNNIGHYSGGRVHIMLAAYMLANMGHRVTIVTDMKPKFLNDLKYIEVEDRIEFIHGEACMKTNWLNNISDNNIDIVIATPRIYEAFSYAYKFSLPCYALLLETPNYVSLHRGGQDSTESYWYEYKKSILEYADAVLCNPGVTLKYAKEWLPDFKGPFYEFPPPINTSAADKVVAEESNEIIFIGRHLDFKCPDDVIKALQYVPEEIRPAINFVGSHNDQVRARLLDKARVYSVDVHFYAGVNDFEKFYLIKRSKMLVIPSKFEGFGMPPAEVMYCKKPVVCYELPITRSIYGNIPIYVPSGNYKTMGKVIRELLEKPEKCVKLGEKGFKAMYSDESNIPCLPMKIKNNLRNIFYSSYPKITAGIIVLNGADTIELCLKSIYDSVDQIIIVEGVVEDYAKQNKELVNTEGFFHSVDDTMEVYNEFCKNNDPMNKIEIVLHPQGRFWKNKNEMQNEIAKRIKCPLYLKVDSDEIWKVSDIEYCRRLFMADPQLTTLYMRRWHFWKDLKTVAVGGQWDSAEARMWRWREDFHHDEDNKKGFNFFVDKNGNSVTDPHYKCMKLLQRMHYHLGYCRNEDHIRGKIKYYANRGIERNVVDRYTNWKPGQATNSTHPDGTTVTKFDGKLPNILTEEYMEKLNVSPKEIIENNDGMMNARSNQSSEGA